jgi:hypothetical protein
MNKTIFSMLMFCFAVFSAGAQVENTQADSKKNLIEQNKKNHEMNSNAGATGTNEATAQPQNPNAPIITFDKMVHDYGTLDYGADGNCEFTFTNTGKEPLVLSNVKAS